jgi:hypothetical protein
MDTKFWGPPGWKLLHTMTLAYEPSRALQMREFLLTLPYVLPCKFCRCSLTDYYRELDYEPALKSRSALIRWLWKIHSMVNDKLRAQGQTIPADPSLAEVRKIYGRYIPTADPNPCEVFPGWDFLFSIANNHPFAGQGSPIPDAPVLKNASDEELNKWNVLPPKRRFMMWRRFWIALPEAMPTVWRQAWNNALKENMPILDTKKSAVAWLWRTRCKFADGADPYKAVCNRLSAHESGCAHSKRARTCRRQKSSKPTRKHKYY